MCVCVRVSVCVCVSESMCVCVCSAVSNLPETHHEACLESAQ